MATGICYTKSGNVKKYERDQLEHNYMESSDKHITVYTVGYPSTAYYPDGYDYSFNIFTYPGPGGNWPMPPGFTEGTAEYLYHINTNPSTPDENWHDTHSKIYNLMSYTPPNGYALDKNGPYTYTAEAKIYSCNLDVKYGGITNSINGGTDTIHKEFRYKKKDSKVYVRLVVSHDIIINGNIYHPYGGDPAINTINLGSGDGRVTNILVGLDSNHYTGSFDISFDGASPSNIKTYLLVNNQYYDVTNSISESKRCNISKYKDRRHIVGWMYTTAGFDYTFSSSDWENNSLITQEGTKDSFGGYIPGSCTAKFIVKFALSNGYSHQDCQLTVDVTTNK